MIDQRRIKLLNNAKPTQGAVLYWMSRDQRVYDNWAVLFAEEKALQENEPLVIAFSLRRKFDHATERMIDFMLGGLKEVSITLSKKNIPFYFLLGDPVDEVTKFIDTYQIGTLISDFSPLSYNRKWKDKLVEKITIPFYEVDAHNIVPVWSASPKQEFGAYTIRPKIHRLLPEFLTEFPMIKKQMYQWKYPVPQINWKDVLGKIIIDHTVQKVSWISPGEKVADKMLHDFVENRLPIYATERNDPTKQAISQLSPYLHFGHIASARIALELEQVVGHSESKNAFLEELIVRKELSDNYCFYNIKYMNSQGFPEWARRSLDQHRDDIRQYTYTREELEYGKTHDLLWNAAQQEMRKTGKMHGYMRMYWAKKILEWSKTPELAQEHAIYLNDRYFLDGRDPNGYTGIAWSIGGVHDRAWFEREIFGKIRYMNFNGAKSKFKVEDYIQKWQD